MLQLRVLKAIRGGKKKKKQNPGKMLTQLWETLS